MTLTSDHHACRTIGDDGELANLCGMLGRAGRFGFDTEFIRERSYLPQLCLVQVATEDFVALIDCFAVDMQPFWSLIKDASVEKIVHAGAQDFEICHMLSAATPANVFDVQVAAGLVGMPYPLSYARLVEQLLNVNVPKAHTFTDWSKRPLRQGQIVYAIEDVAHLAALRKELGLRLEKLGRTDWLREEMNCFEDPRAFVNDPGRAYARVKGASRLTPHQLAVLRELAAWREEAARKADCPPRTFLKDEALIGVVRSRPAGPDQLAEIRFFPRPLARECGGDMLAAVEKGFSQEPELWPSRLAPLDGDSVHRATVDRLLLAGQELCAGEQLSHDLFACRRNYAELAEAFRHNGNVDKLRLMSGWRGKLAASRLLEELAGQ